MNTKHFLTAAILVSGLLFTTVSADAQRNRGDRDYSNDRDYRDDRDYREDRGDRGNRNYRGNNRHHRYQPRQRVIYAPPVIVPRVSFCLTPTHRRPHVRRQAVCAPATCYAPARRAYHHRWHR